MAAMTDAHYLDARSLFREKAWSQLAVLVAGLDDSPSRFVHAWCLLELGEAERGFALLREFLADPSSRVNIVAPLPPFQAPLSVPWGVWELRERFGAAPLIKGGIHDQVLQRCWELAAAQAFNLDHHPDGFAKHWISPDLRAFFTGVSAERRHRIPWQLGGAVPRLPDTSAPALESFVLEAAAQLGQLTPEETWVLEDLRQGRTASLGEFIRKDLRLRGRAQARPADVMRAIASGAARETLLSVFGLAVSTVPTPERAREVCAAFDAFVLLEDLRTRLPADARDRAGQIKRVLFRATPVRALDAVVAELEQPGCYGTLARKVLADQGKPAAFVWVEGTLDDALAAVPDAFFAAAVSGLKGRR